MPEARLPDSVKPVNYKLEIEPDLGKFSFYGNEEIELKITEKTDKITLNAKNLQIENPEISYRGKTITPSFEYDTENERVTFNSNEFLEPGNASIKMGFRGEISSDLVGLYRSKYTKDGAEKYLATTQFEAAHARNAFPSFDEPGKKATFDISFKIDSNLNAISNMPIENETIDGKKKTVKFQRTPVMSTYLVYMGIGEFESISSDHNGINVSIVTVPGKKDQAEFALEATKKFLGFFEDYTGIKYPLPKLDMIAVPDFGMGAMENWGAITFRETTLLYDPKKASQATKKGVAETISHELVHQWFGNLVTMDWWNDLWLNESFASYMAYKAVDNHYPELKMWDHFVMRFTDWGFSEAGTKVAHPINVTVNRPEETDQIFDGITYGMGASTLRMLESHVGQEKFQKGISNYLKKHSYKNTKASDLWESIAEVSDPSVTEIMNGWINNSGYPVVMASQSENTINVSQSKYGGGKEIWKIPIGAKTEKDEKKIVLESKDGEIEINGKYVKLNPSQTGFFRVKYSDEMLEKLKNAVKSKELPVLDRWGLHNDIFNLTISGDVKIDKYLDFLKAYENEDSEMVLGDIAQSMKKIHRVFSKDDGLSNVWKPFKDHMKKPFENAFNNLGWTQKENEGNNDTNLRPLAIGYLAFSGEDDVLKTGQQLFDNAVSGKCEMAPDLVGTITSIAARNGSKNYESLEEMYKKTTNPQQKGTVLTSLYQFGENDTLEKALDFALTDDVRAQDLVRVFRGVTANTKSRDVLLQWMKKNWSILEKHKDSLTVFDDVISSLRIYTGKEAEEAKEFISSKNIPFKSVIDKTFEEMDTSTKWLEENKRALKEYFS